MNQLLVSGRFLVKIGKKHRVHLKIQIIFLWVSSLFEVNLLPRIPFPTRPHLHGVAIAWGRQAPDRVVVRVLGILQASHRAVVAAGDVIRKRRQGLGEGWGFQIFGEVKVVLPCFFFKYQTFTPFFFPEQRKKIEGNKLQSKRRIIAIGYMFVFINMG